MIFFVHWLEQTFSFIENKLFVIVKWN